MLMWARKNGLSLPVPLPAYFERMKARPRQPFATHTQGLASPVSTDAPAGQLTRGSFKTIPASEETTNTQRFEEDSWLTRQSPANRRRRARRRLCSPSAPISSNAPIMACWSNRPPAKTATSQVHTASWPRCSAANTSTPVSVKRRNWSARCSAPRWSAGLRYRRGRSRRRPNPDAEGPGESAESVRARTA
jgi:hypothetical protein